MPDRPNRTIEHLVSRNIRVEEMNLRERVLWETNRPRRSEWNAPLGDVTLTRGCIWAILIPLVAFGLLVGVPALVYVFYLLYQRDPGSLPGLVLFIVGLALIALLLFVALIVAMTRPRRAQAQQLPPTQLGPPQVSPDGRYVWDAQRQQWLPIHSGPTPPPRL
jgi:hypothetical protein